MKLSRIAAISTGMILGIGVLLLNSFGSRQSGSPSAGIESLARIDGASSEHTDSSDHPERGLEDIQEIGRRFLPVPTSSSSVPLPRGAFKPEGNLIEYRVIDGLAIAYGDILLGRPDEEVPGGRGIHEAQVPQYWERPEIPYLINPDLPQPDRVERALRYLREFTPVNFVPHQGERDAIVFEPGSEHCLSPLGRVGGLQPIRLSPGCGWQEILHEILHSLGFMHEQSRTDRDQFVEILWREIDPQYHEQFAIMPESFMQPLRGFSFDFRSVMLYDPTAFARQAGASSMRPVGTATIQPVRVGLSEGDIRRLNRMFRGYE